MNHRLGLVRHGAIVLLIGLLCGLPTVVESLNGDAGRVWHTAHEGLIMMGIWMLVMSSVLPLLGLARREMTVLYASLLGMGYGFAVALVLGGIAGETPFTPGPTLLAFIAFLFAVVGILGSVLSAALTIMGARPRTSD